MTIAQNLPAPSGMISGLKRKSLINTSQMVSPTFTAMPVAKVSTAAREEPPEPQQRINVGNNLSQVRRDLKSSQVQRALRSETFKPLPPEPLESPEEEYDKIVEKSIKSAEFTPVSIKQPSSQKRSSHGLWSLSQDERSSAGFNDSQESRQLNNQTVKNQQKHWGDDTLERIDRVVDTSVAVAAHPLEVLGKTVRNMTNEAYNDWLENGERRKLSKDDYKKAYSKRKSEVRKERRQQAIEKAEADAKYQAETTFGERRLEDAKKVMNAGKKALPVAIKVVKEGLHATKWGIRAVGEVAEEFEKTPMARNLKAQAQVDYRHMKSGARRARESIAATGNKRYLTASSLNKPRTFGTTTNSHGIIGKYERGAGGRTELHFYWGKNRITHSKVAKILTHRQIQEIKNDALLGQQPVRYQAQAQKYQALQTITQTAPVLNVPITHSGLAKKRVKTHSGLMKKRTRGNPIGHGVREDAPFAVVKRPIVL